MRERTNIFGAMLLVALLWSPLCGRALAAQGVTVMGGDTPSLLTLSDFIPHAVTMKTADPNFPEDGVRNYTGIRLSRVLALAGLDNTARLTVIGSDQYVGLLSPDQAARGILAWEMDGKPVSGIKGGPLKVMFEQGDGMHASCYTWYVETLARGEVESASLTVALSGKKQVFGRDALVEMSEALPQGMFSIVQGCRSAFREPSYGRPVRAVRFSRLMAAAHAGSPHFVTLEPYAGAPIHLSSPALAFDAYIIVSCDGRPVHPALGGPYSVVFPVEAHPELVDLLPESGALFFLTTITAE